MGEKYLGQLTAKSAPATGDIMVLEDSEDTKKIDYDALANAILNKLTTKTYTVGGGTQTLISAIDALNSNSYSLKSGTALAANTNLNTITTPGNYVSASASVSGTLVNSPVTNMGFSLKVENVNNELAILQRITTRGATVQVYERTATTSGGTTTWDGEWKLVPTRAEMNALNSKETLSITASTGTWPSEITLHDTSYAYRLGSIVMVHLNLKIVSTTKKNLTISSVLPESMRPRFGVQVMGGDGDTDGICQPFMITPEGSISMWNTKTGTTYLQADATYIAKSGT